MRGFRDDSRETTWAESKCRPLGTCKAETDVPMLRAVSEKREGECSWHCYTECCLTSVSSQMGVWKYVETDLIGNPPPFFFVLLE